MTFILIVIAVFATARGFEIRHDKLISESEEQAIIQNSQKIDSLPAEKISILAFGDVMLDREVFIKTQKAGDFNHPFLKIDELFQGEDIKLANLEGPITDYESQAIKDNGVRFTNSPLFLPALKSRFDILSLANNHNSDFGREGARQTKEFLFKEGIQYFGGFRNDEDLSVVLDKNGIKVGIVGYNMWVPENLQNVLNEIKRLKTVTDFVIVLPHWGAEYKDEPDWEQRADAKKLIEAGANLVLGNHPHAVQTVEVYQGKMIFYSLGNFVFDMDISERVMRGLGVRIGLERNPTGVIEDSYELLPFKINIQSQPELMGQQDAETFLKWLAKISKAAGDSKAGIEKGLILNRQGL